MRKFLDEEVEEQFSEMVQIGDDKFLTWHNHRSHEFTTTKSKPVTMKRKKKEEKTAKQVPDAPM